MDRLRQLHQMRRLMEWQGLTATHDQSCRSIGLRRLLCRTGLPGHLSEEAQMKRRDFNRIALVAGLSPFLSKPTLAQWYEGPSPPTQPPPQKFNIVIKHSPRTYNQVNVPRRSAAGRRFTIYWTWRYPWEANRDVTALDNRFSTI